MKIFMLLVMFVVLSSCVFAGPFRDLEINVVDPLGEPVQDANVSMYATYNNYFNYNGITDPNGYLLLEVDARIWELAQQQYENLTEGVGPNNAKRVAVKETITRVTGNAAKNPSFLFPVMIFNYDLSALGVYDFISMTFERNFSLRHNVELQFVVSDGTPLINLPVNLETNEDNNHEIIINLEDYITDYDNDFDELDITITDEVWSAADASIEVVGNELIIDFLPALNLDYHQDNTVTFTIKADDGVHSNEKKYSYSYMPEYKALLGNVTDLYYEDFVSDFGVELFNGYDDLTIMDNNLFITFFNNDKSPKLSITQDDYYDSVRYINSEDSEDISYDFTLALIQLDVDYGGDYLENGFTRVFRDGGFQGGLTRWESASIFCVHDSGSYGYNPGPSDFAKVETTLGFVNEFTNELMDPFDGNHLLYDQDDFCDYQQNPEFGYTFIYWDPSIPGAGEHGEMFAVNGVTIIKAVATLKDSYTGQSTYNQEIIQTLGPRHDIDSVFVQNYGPYWPPGESTFCDEIPNCSTVNVPTWFDFKWGQMAYQREVGNKRFDNDPSALSPDSISNKFTEVLEFYEFNIDGDKELFYKKLGYAPANQPIKRKDVVTKLPSKAELIMYDYDAKEIKTKNNYQKNNIKKSKIDKIKKLIIPGENSQTK